MKQDVLEYQKTLAVEMKSRQVDLEDKDQELMELEAIETFCEQIYLDYDKEEREKLSEWLEEQGKEQLEVKCPALKHIYAQSTKPYETEATQLCRVKIASLKEAKPVSMEAMRELQDFENTLWEEINIFF